MRNKCILLSPHDDPQRTAASMIFPDQAEREQGLALVDNQRDRLDLPRVAENSAMISRGLVIFAARAP